MPLAVVDVSADPALSFLAGGSAGVTLHALTYSGACRVEKRSAKMLEGHQAAQLGFYVPQAGPFRPSHLLSAWAEVTPAMLHVDGGQRAWSRPYGVHDVTVQLVDDDKGSGMMWPYVWMTVVGGDPMLLRYRVTVTQPLENA